MALYSRNFLFFLLIIIGISVLRLLFLNYVPNSINTDELHYALSAKSFALTGKDIAQTVTPRDVLLFHYPTGEPVQAELPYFLEMLTQSIAPFSLVANALPNAVIGILIILIIFLITKGLTGDDNIAMIAAVLTAANPWFFVMSRTSYENIPATFFYLFGFYILLKAKKWHLLFSIPIFLLAFYSYIGTKIILLPFVIVAVFYRFFKAGGRHYKKQYAIILLATVIFLAFYLFQQNQNSSTTRVAEILTPASMANQTFSEKYTFIFQPLQFLFVNNVWIYIKTLLINAYDIFSPTYLFLKGDYFFSFELHGLFYAIDFIFLIAGIGWLYSHKKQLLGYLTTFIFISILPQILHDQSGNFTPHISLMIPFLIIIISVGVWAVIRFLYQKKLRPLILVLVFVYIYLFGNFLNFYFFQLPKQPTTLSFSDRVIASYILWSGAKNKVFIYTQDSQLRFKSYIFYNNLVTKSSASKIAHALLSSKYTLGNVTFLPCRDLKNKVSQSSIIVVRRECSNPISKATPIFINPLSEVSNVYTIYGDFLCSQHKLNNSRPEIKVNDFMVENLSNENFCNKFVFK